MLRQHEDASNMCPDFVGVLRSISNEVCYIIYTHIVYHIISPA